VRRVIHLPDRGRLIVSTDVQGNVVDFDRVAALFEDAAKDADGAYLVVTGDLVHGPELTEAEWPDYLGTFYNGDSKTVLEHARELADRFPGRVHYLLGNHEHAHVGGPVVSKFFPDEAGSRISWGMKAPAACAAGCATGPSSRPHRAPAW